MNKIYWMSSICAMWDEIIHKKKLLFQSEKLLRKLHNELHTYAKACLHKCMNKFKSGKENEQKSEKRHTSHKSLDLECLNTHINFQTIEREKRNAFEDLNLLARVCFFTLIYRRPKIKVVWTFLFRRRMQNAANCHHIRNSMKCWRIYLEFNATHYRSSQLIWVASNWNSDLNETSPYGTRTLHIN